MGGWLTVDCLSHIPQQDFSLSVYSGLSVVSLTADHDLAHAV